jgi:outer membrane lipoprotein carrier protein
MYVSKLERSPYSAVLTLLEGNGRLMRAFELRLVDPKRAHIKTGRVLEAVPREATPAYEKLLLYVDDDTGRVDRILILDAQGNSNRFELEGAVINGKIPSREFRFSPPAGTKVIKP